jgi:CDP-diacylglycerol---glycerol-3-phosphate 3-phosphatidyltransferase
MNLPNCLTLTRIVLVPLLVVVLLTKFEGRLILGFRKELVGAAIFGLASLTDWLDGYLARRRDQVTALGQMIDPLADKFLTSAAFISLVQMGLAPAWMVAVIIGREFAVTGLRSIAYTRNVTIPASPLGKVKMGSQVVAILLLILGSGCRCCWCSGRARCGSCWSRRSGRRWTTIAASTRRWHAGRTSPTSSMPAPCGGVSLPRGTSAG